MLLISLTACDVWITFRPILDLVETLLLAIESLYLNHIESVYKQRLLDRVIQRTIR